MANCIQCGRKLPGLTFGRKICVWCKQHEAAQRGEADDDARQPVMAVPWVRRESTITLTHVLFGANIAVFIAMVVANGSIEAFPGQILLHFGANYGPYTLSGGWWRVFAYMFVHADIFHIGFNMWCLWSFGSLCESLYGKWTFGAIYLLTGLAGGLARLAWDPWVPSVGASGAIFGLTGALIASFYLGEFNIPSYVIQANLKSLLFFAGFNILFGISPIGDLFGIHVDNACHIGGLVSGLLLGALIAVIAPQQDALRRVAVLGVVALLVIGSAFQIERWRGPSIQFGRSLVTARGHNLQMISELQAKVQKDPQDASAHYALAHAYFVDGQFPAGETQLERVLELQPQNAQARLDLGAAYLSQDQPEKAEVEFTKLVKQDPSNAEAHVALAMALADQDHHDAAINEYKAALRLNPQMRGVYYRLGISQSELRQYDDAIASFLKEREADGDSSDLELALADAYQAKGMTQQAEEAQNRAERLKSGQPH